MTIYLIVNTDRVKYIVDTSANRIVVNNAILLINLTMNNTNIKGFRGTHVQIIGRGKHCLPLKVDDRYLDS